jgi:hypothetical protein
MVKEALTIFGIASGLFSNLDKSVATPLNCSEDEIQLVTAILGCRIEGLLCWYLRVMLSVTRLSITDEQPLVDKVASRIPGWKGKLLSLAGRIALAQATLSAIPIHTSIAACLSPWVIKAIDKLRRAFIWAGSEVVAGGKCKVAWPVVCLPKQLGGLGVSDLRRVGVALRVRWVWQDRRAGRRVETSDRSVLALFHNATRFSVGNGESTYFWSDRWLGDTPLKLRAPHVFAAVKPRKRKVPVAEALLDAAWVRYL